MFYSDIVTIMQIIMHVCVFLDTTIYALLSILLLLLLWTLYLAKGDVAAQQNNYLLSCQPSLSHSPDPPIHYTFDGYYIINIGYWFHINL